MVSKVLHVASGDLWAGAEVQIWMLVRNLKRQGLDVRVLLLNEGELALRLRKDKIPVYVLDESKLCFATLVFASRQIVRDFQPHIIHSHRLKEHLIAALCKGLSGGMQLFRTVHGGAEFTPSIPQRVLRGLDQWMARRKCVRTIAVSEPMLPELQAQLGSSRVSLVENAIDLCALESAVAAASKDLEQDKLHIGIVGRLEPVKRVDRFIQAATEHCSMNPDSHWRFHIVGDGSERSSLMGSVKAAGLEHRVSFHGHVNNSAGYLSQFHAVVMCSEHEGMPMVGLETLALGRHLVCNGVGGLGSLKGFNGCHIYDQSKPHALLEALQVVAGQESCRDDRFMRRYSADQMAVRMCELYGARQAEVATCQ
ncbi:glycosyltransferase [Simiduia agarivorans]|uniref:Group 1 glycosyl transferase n=1 Tax=Simiduia agarivorans (strain DSM 21679 / JCM 13881 / BCRC 17597 / SA1) TaxID=1117647 RepID=K4KII1_SIMAS|nr:glycosyltransferase [Simiduia agarivorans]AFU98959.1 group 1 glycosyl transferase [Simiduia agarivorans SA1 = DSM 21679]